MNQEIERYITLAQNVAAHAKAGSLDHRVALQFCEVVLPTLLVELDIARRVDSRLAALFPEQKPCEATVCSSRWKPDAAEKPAKAKKKATKKAKRRRVKDDAAAS